MIAERNQMALPETFRDAEQGERYAFHDLASFLTVYFSVISILITEEDFYDVAYAYLLKCQEENVVHVELFFNPQAHTGRGVPFSTIMRGIRQAIIKARAELDVSVGLIMCFMRDQSVDSAMAALIDALPYKEWIVGVGLDSDGDPPIAFNDVFQRAKKEGFMVTAHCDADNPDSLQHIQQCLEQIGVDRIDHGENIIEDDRLLEIARRKGIGLTCCPISNTFVAASSKVSEIRQLMNEGVRITINSDDPPYFDGYLEANLLKMANDGELSLRDLVTLQQHAFNVSWISAADRSKYLKALDAFASSAGVL